MNRWLSSLVYSFALITSLTACPSNPPTNPPTIISFSATPSILAYGGGQVTLSWTQADATVTTIDSGVGDVSNVSQKTITVSATTTFTMTVTNNYGTAEATTTVSVLPRYERLCTAEIPTSPPATAVIDGDNNFKATFSTDNVRVAYPYFSTTNTLMADVWTDTAWSTVTLSNENWDHFVGFQMISVNGKFVALYFGLTTAHAWEFNEAVEQDDGSFTTYAQTWFDVADTLLSLTANQNNGHLGILYLVGNNYMWADAPVGGTTASTSLLTVGGSFSHATNSPVGVGYSPNGSPWFFYIDTVANTLNLARQGSPNWSVAATSAPFQDKFTGSASVTASLDGTTALVLFGTQNPNLVNADWGSLVDMSTSTIAKPVLLVADVANATGIFTAAFSPDSASLVYGLDHNQAWTGTGTATSLAAATPFHPELYIFATSLQMFYNSCGDPMVSDKNGPLGGGPGQITIEAL